MKPAYLLVLNFIFFYQFADAQDFKKILVQTADLIYAPEKDRIYATVPNVSPDLTYRNRLIVINPYLGTIENSYFVGSDPSSLALSEDGQFLYIGLRGAPSYVKFDLYSHTIWNTFNVGNGTNISNPAYVEQIQTVRNSSGAVVISRRNSCCSPRHEGVAVYDEGVKRSTNTPGHSGSNSITSTEDPTVLWGYNNETTEFGLRKLKIKSSGISVEGIFFGLIDGFSNTIKYFDKRIYSTSGAVIEVRDSTPSKIGQFNVPGNNGRDMVIDTAAVFFAIGGSTVQLVRFDKKTFTQVNSQVISTTFANISKLIQWGDSYRSRFAFSTPQAVIIMRQCNSLIQSPITISSPNGTAICQKDSLKLTASGNFNNYLWSNGAVGKDIYVKDAGSYTVAVLDSTGCQSAPSPSVQVTIENPPYQPYIYPSSNVSFCIGGSVRLTASNSNSRETIIWSNGAIGNNLDVNQAGVYTCRAVSVAGCRSEPSQPVSVLQKSDSIPPRPTITIVGDTSFCWGTNSVTLSAQPQISNYQYRWSSGANSASITLKEIHNSGKYSVKLSTVSGCESEMSESVNVNIKSSPLAPRIFANGKLLASSEPSDNQWYLNGQPILGATQQFYNVTQNGFYQVRVIKNNCPSPLSEIANVLVKTHDLDESTVSMVPNPAHNDLLIFLNQPDIITLHILDINGVSHFSHKIESTGVNLLLDIGHLPNGIYLVNFKDKLGQTKSLKKLVKM